MFLRAKFFRISFCFSWAFGIFAEARLYNYQDVPIGERSFGMGSASMAVEGDTGNMYFNPAVLADSEFGQFSAALSSYARIDTRTGKYVSLFTSAKDNISRGGFVAIPSLVGGHVRSKGWVWGGVILVPESFSISGSLNIGPTDLAVFESSFGNVWMGAFASKRVNDRHRVGLSIFYNSVDSREKFSFFQTDTTPPTIRFVDQNYNGNGVVAIVGGVYDYSESVKIGYSLRSGTLLFAGTGHFGDISTESGSTAVSEDFKLKFIPQPVRLSAGVAWQVDSKSLFAMDLHLYGTFNKNLSSLGQSAFKVSSKDILNVNVGYEYMGWKNFGLRIGVSTNFSSAKTLSQTLSAMNDRVNMVTGTAAAVFDGIAGTISVGGYIQGGQGSSIPIDDIGSLVPRSNYIYGFVVGSSYKFK